MTTFFFCFFCLFLFFSNFDSIAGSPFTPQLASSLGYPNVVYKVISAKDSLPYALRRIDSVRNTSAQVTSSAVSMWAQFASRFNPVRFYPYARLYVYM